MSGSIQSLWPRVLFAGLMAVSQAACGAGGGTASTPADGIAAKVWLTTGDRAHLLAQQPDVHFLAQGVERDVIDVDARVRFQEMVGFGASITDASAWLIRNKLSDEQRAALMRDLFSIQDGIGLSFTRLTIGASDFSMHHYSLDDPPAGQADPSLAHFSIAPNRADVLPVLRDALAINPQIKVMASPWSAPAWMKTTGSLVKGRLKADAYGAFADYFVRYLDAYAQEGIPIHSITVQNEPHFEPPDYPGMRMDSAERARFIGEHLGPRLATRTHKTKIVEWDHNWDEPSAPLSVLADPVANRYIDGVGWHCYVGNVAVQSAVRDAHPDKETYFTECSGGAWKPHFAETFPWFMRHLVIGTTRHWAKGVLLWNLALDENHGPHLGGCKDCRGVVTIDSKTGAVTRELDYYALAHASRFVRPGAFRVFASPGTTDLDSVAFQNADDRSIVLLVSNSATAPRRFSVRHGGKSMTYTLPASSAVTFVWPGT